MIPAAGARTWFNPHHLGVVAAVALAYFGAARLGLSLAFSTKLVTALWPPTGIAVAALLLGGYRVWPAIYLAAFAVNYLVGGAILTAAGIAVGNTLGPVVVKFALDRLEVDPTLARNRDILGLIACGAVLGAAVSATNDVLCRCWKFLAAMASRSTCRQKCLARIALDKRHKYETSSNMWPNIDKRSRSTQDYGDAGLAHPYSLSGSGVGEE